MDAELVDWDLAVTTARRLVRPGPSMSRTEAEAVVADLRRLAVEAERHVEDYTHLHPVGPATPIAVVDRQEWIRSNVAGLRVVTAPLLEKVSARSPNRLSTVVGSRVTGVQLGSALSYLAGKVLGQYEVFLPPQDARGADDGRAARDAAAPQAAGSPVAAPAAIPPDAVALNAIPPDGAALHTVTPQDGVVATPGPVGRLSLVAPNIAHAEQVLGVVPRDFRLWVCLHEQTHRSQFVAVPWLRGHLEQEIGAFIDATDLDPDVLADRVRSAITALYNAVRDRGPNPNPNATSGAVAKPNSLTVMEALQTPAQRAVLDRLQALMTLLEGHADQVMDAVGPKVVPSVTEIRAKFDTRRSGGSPIDRVIRRLLGLDLKLQQYRQGRAFVRAVVAEVGVDGFNTVWRAPSTLPTRAELLDPPAWMERVLGSRPSMSA